MPDCRVSSQWCVRWSLVPSYAQGRRQRPYDSRENWMRACRDTLSDFLSQADPPRVLKHECAGRQWCYGPPHKPPVVPHRETIPLIDGSWASSRAEQSSSPSIDRGHAERFSMNRAGRTADFCLLAAALGVLTHEAQAGPDPGMGTGNRRDASTLPSTLNIKESDLWNRLEISALVAAGGEPEVTTPPC